MRNDLKLTPWTISHRGPGWADDFCESILFLGNGRMGVRGYLSSEPAPRPVQKGLYLAGIFGEIKPGITDFVNLLTPVREAILIDGAEPSLAGDVERSLNLQEATLTIRYTLSANGKRLEIQHQRFLPKDHTALLLQRLTLIPSEDMELIVSSGILPDSCNSPIPDDQTKANTETVQLSHPGPVEVSSQGISCTYSIGGSNLTVNQETTFYCPDFTYVRSDGTAAVYRAVAKCGQALTLDKISCIRTSRDIDPRISGIPENWSYDALLAAHRAAWADTWRNCDLDISAYGEDLQVGLRYAMFQLLGSCSAKDPTVSIGARGLSHARYKGCYFWDTDLFMLPFFLENDLEAARNLCDYRARSLPAAKAHAQKMNAAGARYPWMAALDGSEQCETWDIGCSEVHITADVAFALDAYCKRSGDEAFYLDKAAEVFIETARFWVSRYTYRPETGVLICSSARAPTSTAASPTTISLRTSWCSTICSWLSRRQRICGKSARSCTPGWPSPRKNWTIWPLCAQPSSGPGTQSPVGFPRTKHCTYWSLWILPSSNRMTVPATTASASTGCSGTRSSSRRMCCFS